MPRRLQFFTTTRGIDMAAFGDFRFFRLRVQMSRQVTQHLLEYHRIVVEFGQHAIDRALHLLDQLAIVLAFVEPVQATLGNGIQQLPCRVCALGEETLVA